MKKVLFLMFLLFLIGLGTASVKAQVRIGGNAAPNAAAVLDLNTTDATNNGTKGLALPRVNLTDTLMQLTTGTTNLTGMLVYNTGVAINAGIYSWNGNRWVLANLPAATPADSGRALTFDGKGWVLTPTASWLELGFATPTTLNSPGFLEIPSNTVGRAVCMWHDGSAGTGGVGYMLYGHFHLINNTGYAYPPGTILGIRCVNVNVTY